MTRRQRVLAHLAEHPELTTHEIAKALDGGRGGQYLRLLTDMQRKGQLLRVDVERDDRKVTGWSVAPPGTKPVLIADPDRELKRARDRAYKRRQRARAKGEDPETAATRQPWRRLNLPVAAFPDRGNWRLHAACLGENPDLFFSFDPADITKAQRICDGCPVKLPCHRYAEGNGEVYGVWAGIDRERQHAEQVAS
jgi:WhiB family transcriptional regulator, redox-sensing transcriptional regulator